MVAKSSYGLHFQIWLTTLYQLKTLFNQGLFDYFQDPNLLWRWTLTEVLYFVVSDTGVVEMWDKEMVDARDGMMMQHFI
jgi:hypothetical protein